MFLHAAVIRSSVNEERWTTNGRSRQVATLAATIRLLNTVTRMSSEPEEAGLYSAATVRQQQRLRRLARSEALVAAATDPEELPARAELALQAVRL
jgi:hypothetical protein